MHRYCHGLVSHIKAYELGRYFMPPPFSVCVCGGGGRVGGHIVIPCPYVRTSMQKHVFPFDTFRKISVLD